MTQTVNDPSVWFVRVGENTFGPYPLRRVRAFINEGRIRAHTHVRIGEGGEFTTAAESPVLGPLLRLRRGSSNDKPAPNTATKDPRITRAAERLVKAVAPKAPTTASDLKAPPASKPAVETSISDRDTSAAPETSSAAAPISPVEPDAPSPVTDRDTGRDGAKEEEQGDRTSPNEAAKRIQALLESHAEEDLPRVAGAPIASLSPGPIGPLEGAAPAHSEEPETTEIIIEAEPAANDDSPASDEPDVAIGEAPAEPPSLDTMTEEALDGAPSAPEPRKRGSASAAVALAAALDRDFDDDSDDTSAVDEPAAFDEFVEAEIDVSSPPEAPRPSPPAVGDDAASLLVVAQLRTTSEASIESVLAQFGPTAKASPGVWFVRALASCDELRNAISRKLGARDTLIIVDTSHDEAAWFNIGADRDNAIRVLRDKAAEEAA